MMSLFGSQLFHLAIVSVNPVVCAEKSKYAVCADMFVEVSEYTGRGLRVYENKLDFQIFF